MAYLLFLLIGLVVGAILFYTNSDHLGDSYKESRPKAEYQLLKNQSSQISSATAIYINDHAGQPPENVAELIDKGYIAKKFTAISGNVGAEGETQETADWRFGFDDYSTQLMDTPERCAAINGAAGGSDSVDDIPLCSSDYDESNPCCLDSGT